MRTKHPFQTYEAIFDQPRAFGAVVAENESKIQELSRLIEQAQTVFLVGTGTSHYNAWASRFILRTAFPDKSIFDQTAMDFALYEELVDEQSLVIVFSYRGDKQYALQSLEKARSAGAPGVLIAGHQKNRTNKSADLLLETVSQQESSAHTVSYTSALALVVAAANGPVEELGQVLADGLKLEPAMKKEAAKAKDVRKIWLAGGGPNEITAKEIALKIKETSYKHAEGLGTEELFHGPFQAAEPEDLFILIVPEGKAQDRTLQLAPAIKEIGATVMIVGDNKAKGTHQVSKVAEEYTTISCITPLYLFTYHLALAKGTNPDSYRLEDPRFANAFKYMKL